MELLDRYLQAVKKHLPWKRQDDIIAELRANLESQLEEKEAELGRPLTEKEAEEWLKQIGPPIQMASRYHPQQYLIGPTLFPVYWYVLRLVFFWSVAVYLVVAGVQLAVHETVTTASAVQAVLRIPGVIINSAAWVTVVFAAIELVARYYPEKLPPQVQGVTRQWSPSTLPPLEPEAAPGVKRRSYAQAVAELAFESLFLIWMLLIPRNPFLLLGPGVAFLNVIPYQLAPVWTQFYWWLVGLGALQVAWHAIELLRGKWRTPNRWQGVVFKAIGLIAVIPLLTAQGHVLVMLKHPELDQARYAAALHSINQGVYTAMAIACAIVVRCNWWVKLRRWELRRIAGARRPCGSASGGNWFQHRGAGDGNHADVVFLPKSLSGTCYLGGIAGFGKQRLDSVEAEESSAGVGRFGDSVGKHDQPIAGFQRKAHDREFSGLSHA